MKKIKWIDKYLVGVPRIDHEHQVFVDLISTISVEAELPNNRQRLLDLLREFELYAQFHFCSEENIMKQAQYPKLKTHLQEHRMLLGNLKTLIREFQIGSQTVMALVDFLMNWFAFHTMSEDLELGRYLFAQNSPLVGNQQGD